MAILMLGANIGMIFGFIVGGAISEQFGWRVALMAVGAPGILLTFVVMMFLKEPARGTFEGDEHNATTDHGDLQAPLGHAGDPVSRHRCHHSVDAGLRAGTVAAILHDAELRHRRDPGGHHSGSGPRPRRDARRPHGRCALRSRCAQRQPPYSPAARADHPDRCAHSRGRVPCPRAVAFATGVLRRSS